jgi:uncharacterized protein with FMN-binding domain
MSRIAIVLSLASVFALLACGCKTGKEVEKTLTMQITDVDLSKVQNGTYMGSHPVGIMDYNVEVTVADNSIKKIGVVKAFSGTEYSRKGRAILDTVLARQTLDVDVITGATVTSKAYLAAVRDALVKGLVE